MNRPLLVILATATLDAVGMGLVLPILPSLLREVSHETEVAEHFGYFLAVYALMQFVFSPILGALSDRFGRRPILLASLAGATVDYLLMTFAPTLGWLYAGRVVAGITGANMAVATAYLADISAEDERADRYGALNACFGLGFVIGPLLGGVIGAGSPRLPFAAAALFNGLNFLLALVALPESHEAERKAFTLPHLNPFRSLRWVFGVQGLFSFVLVYWILCCADQVPATIWVIYGEDRYHWDTRTVGLSFAFYGLLHSGAQAFLTGRLTQRWGNRGTLVIALLIENFGYLLMAVATQSWMPFAICVPLAIGGIATPALQAIMSNRVGEDQQGELQGTLVSLLSLASIAGPVLVTNFYEHTKPTLPGAVWIVGAFIYLLCFPILWHGRRRTKQDDGVLNEALQDPASIGEHP
ncbi:Tet(A)/Tet(B)/Tet(C) family tetracycline efflux MFS transporter [Paludisphaera rhizosphaerae]|uniref:Tet(A)/Tet(B)/Tet(C) family tetracycline efflux MFS transporter n=1 Tax=Paludisphaera rhizosphaerae TaxID=2711216 RepID=UPI0013EBC82A|nr:Tet(A)/Tet(B)/Tet(C) family tetracycline efflux MFS transporter [Paludisphaera rhizosphaerae]